MWVRRALDGTPSAADGAPERPATERERLKRAEALVRSSQLETARRLFLELSFDLERQGLHRRALAVALRALELGEHPAARLRVGELCGLLDRREDALRHLRRAAAALEAEGAPVDRLAVLKAIVHLAPRSIPDLVRLGQLAGELGDRSFAEKCFARAARLRASAPRPRGGRTLSPDLGPVTSPAGRSSGSERFGPLTPPPPGRDALDAETIRSSLQSTASLRDVQEEGWTSITSDELALDDLAAFLAEC